MFSAERRSVYALSRLILCMKTLFDAEYRYLVDIIARNLEICKHHRQGLGRINTAPFVPG